MNFFKDVIRFLSYLTLVDIIFFTAILLLLILLVSLIYFIKINKDDEADNNIQNNQNNGLKSSDKSADKVEEIMENLGLNTMSPEPKEEYNDEEEELLDLEGLTKKLQKQSENEQASISKYEEEQEEKAIISYDELLASHHNYAINYEKEEVMDDLIVKKVNLNDLLNTTSETKDDPIEVRVISYQKEEAFLNALKELNNLLN